MALAWSDAAIAAIFADAVQVLFSWTSTQRPKSAPLKAMAAIVFLRDLHTKTKVSSDARAQQVVTPLQGMAEGIGSRAKLLTPGSCVQETCGNMPTCCQCCWGRSNGMPL